MKKKTYTNYFHISQQFIGSEESILEFPAESSAASTTNPAAVSISSRPSGPLVDLIRSRDFVIDFPRVFVLESGSDARRRSSIFTHGIPERSQSSMGLSQAKDWMCTVANKLEEQHGLRRARKDSQKSEMLENLLSVRHESMKMRRSHSTEGRYCVRKELESPEAQANSNTDQNLEGACGGPSCSNSCATSRRNSTSNIITQLQPIMALKFDILNKRRKSNTSRQISDVNLRTWPVTETTAPKPITKGIDLPNITIDIVDENN